MANVNALLSFIKEIFKKSPRIGREALIQRLVEVCGMPHSDAHYFIKKLQQEDFFGEPTNSQLGLDGN